MDISYKKRLLEKLNNLALPDSTEELEDGSLVVTYRSKDNMSGYLEIRLENERYCLTYVDSNSVIDNQEIISYIAQWEEYIIVSLTDYLNINLSE